MQLDSLKLDIIKEHKNFFGSKIDNFIIKEARSIPSLRIFIGFTVYKYVYVSIDIESTALHYSTQVWDRSITLFSAEIPSLLKERHGPLIAQNILARLDEELRLRIPDKYLIAKGWY